MIGSSDRIRVSDKTVTVRRIIKEGLFKEDLALKRAKAKKVIEAKPVEKKRKESLEVMMKSKRANRGFNPDFELLTADSKPPAKKRAIESTSIADNSKSSSKKHADGVHAADSISAVVADLLSADLLADDGVAADDNGVRNEQNLLQW